MTDNSLWRQLDMLNKIVELLSGVEYRLDPHHHLAPPFVTAYQLAIMFASRHPEDFGVFCSRGFPMGGRGSGATNSLPQYLARQLSQRIRSGEISCLIEGGFLDDGHVNDMVFDYQCHDIRPSVDWGYELGGRGDLSHI